MSDITDTKEYRYVCNELKNDCIKFNKTVIGAKGYLKKSEIFGINMLVTCLEFLDKQGLVSHEGDVSFKITYEGYEFFLNNQFS